MNEELLALFTACTNRPVVYESTLNPPGAYATPREMSAYMLKWEEAGRPYVITDQPVETSDDVEVYIDSGYGMLFVLEGLTGKAYMMDTVLTTDRFAVLDKHTFGCRQYVWWPKT